LQVIDRDESQFADRPWASFLPAERQSTWSGHLRVATFRADTR